VVETAVRRWRGRAAPAGAGLFAVLFLLVMVVSGRTRPTQNLVKFEAAGLMRAAPDQIDRVELTTKGRRVILARREKGRWTLVPEAGELAARAVSHLEMSLKFMHVTAPVRVMSRNEYQGEALGEYGLDPPRYTISLHGGSQTVLATSFGGKNPQDILQYVRVEGRDELYLLPIFVGREWELVVDGVLAP
jgi:hypothetical protein